MASWTFDFHTDSTTKVWTDYFPMADDHPLFTVVHIGDALADIRLYIRDQEFCARLIRKLEEVQAQLAFAEIVEEETDETPSCP